MEMSGGQNFRELNWEEERHSPSLELSMEFLSDSLTRARQIAEKLGKASQI